MTRVAESVGFGIVIATTILLLIYAPATDAHAFWLTDPQHPYGGGVGEAGAYLYPPAFIQLIAPLQAVPWEVFRAVWIIADMAALVWLIGPLWSGIALVAPAPIHGWLEFSPVFLELWYGNLPLFMAAAIVIGFRHPAAWSLMLLTKVTTGVGALWFLVRREWHALTTAVVVAGGVAGISFVADPGLWFEWFAFMAENAQSAPVAGGGEALLLRLTLATLIAAAGAYSGRAWTIPIAVLLAHPVIWVASACVLLAIPRLLRPWPAVASPTTDPSSFGRSALRRQ